MMLVKQQSPHIAYALHLHCDLSVFDKPSSRPICVNEGVIYLFIF